MKNKFERKLFDFFFKNSKILFILDGIDEISPVFKKCVLNMIKLVKESGNRLLVTTRTHLTAELVTVLETPAIKLRPFTEPDQVEFLTKFWEQQWPDSVAKKAQFKTKANRILEKFKENLNRRDFVEIPLQLYMLAEVFGDAEITDDEMNLFLLYKKFVAKKINIWINDKGSLAKNDSTEIQTSEFNVRSMHQKLAIENMFGKAVADSLFPTLGVTLNQEMILRIGLIKIALSDYVEFVHKTYAEFLIADYCFAKIITNTQSLGVDILVKMFLERDYENVRKFINEKLKTEAGFLHSMIKWQDLAIELSREENQSVVTQLVSEKLINLAIFVLNTETIGKKEKLALVKHENKYFGNSLQVAMPNLDSFSTLWDCVKSFADLNDQKELLLSGSETGTILEQAFRTKNYTVLKFVLEVLSEVMNEEEFKELVSQRDRNEKYFIVEAAEAQDVVALEIFWTMIEKKLKVKDQKLILFGLFEEIPKGILLELTEYSRDLSCLLKTIEKSLHPNEIKHFLRGEDWVVHVLCYFARRSNSECFSNLWSFVEDHFKDKKDRKLFLLMKVMRNNVLVQSFCNENASTRRAVFDIARGLMTQDEIRVGLTTAGSNGLLGFHYALLYGNASAYIDFFEQECNIKLSERDIRQLLKMTFPDGRNVAFYFRFYGTTKKDRNVAFNFLVNNLAAAEVKDMLLKKDNERGYNAFCKALTFTDPFLVEILEWFKSNFDIKEVEIVFTEKTSNMSRNLLHLASYYCEEKDMKNLIEFLEKCKFHKSVVKCMLLTQDANQDIPLYVALLNKYFRSMVQIVWNIYIETFDENELKALISEDRNKILQYRKTASKEAVDLLISLANAKFKDIFET